MYTHTYIYIIYVLIKSPSRAFTYGFSGLKRIQNILYPPSERHRNAHSQFTAEKEHKKNTVLTIKL